MSKRIPRSLDLVVIRVFQDVVNPQPRLCREVGSPTSYSLRCALGIEAADVEFARPCVSAECATQCSRTEVERRNARSSRPSRVGNVHRVGYVIANSCLRRTKGLINVAQIV